jgi:hypothetical protein
VHHVVTDCRELELSRWGVFQLHSVHTESLESGKTGVKVQMVSHKRTDGLAAETFSLCLSVVVVVSVVFRKKIQL